MRRREMKEESREGRKGEREMRARQIDALIDRYIDRQIDIQIDRWMDSEEIGRKYEDREKSRRGEETAILFNHEREKLRGHHAKV